MEDFMAEDDEPVAPQIEILVLDERQLDAQV